MFGRKQDNILIIKMDGLAAFVAAEPAFESIRRTHPTAKISLLTQPGLQRIARAAPHFDLVAGMPNLKDAESRKAFVKQLKLSKFARVYDLSADEDAKRLFAAMGPFRPKWLAVEPAPRKRKGAAYGPELPDIDKAFAAAGIEMDPRRPNFSWALAARKDSANMQPSWFGIAGAFGLLLPGPNAEQRWPAANYARLAQMMSRNHIMPVLAGPKELHAFGDELAHEAPEIVDLTGKTDHLQLVALAQEAAFFVTDHAEEAPLAMSVGSRGVMVRKSNDPGSPPEGRHVVVVTAKDALADANPDFVWRTLHNMGLIPDAKAERAATSR